MKHNEIETRPGDSTRPEYRPGRPFEEKQRPLTDRVALMLRSYFTGLSVPRLAHLLGEDPGSVRMALERLQLSGRATTRAGWPDVWIALPADVADEIETRS